MIDVLLWATFINAIEQFKEELKEIQLAGTCVKFGHKILTASRSKICKGVRTPTWPAEVTYNMWPRICDCLLTWKRADLITVQNY